MYPFGILAIFLPGALDRLLGLVVRCVVHGLNLAPSFEEFGHVIIDFLALNLVGFHDLPHRQIDLVVLSLKPLDGLQGNDDLAGGLLGVHTDTQVNDLAVIAVHVRVGQGVQ